jgi:hypothetical protein
MAKGDGKGWRKGMTKPVDYKLLKSLCALQCTDEEMASVLGIGHATFERRKKKDELFQQAYEEGKAEGRVSLRRQQYQAANAGNITMQIWLGKQFLGQTDKADLSSGGKPFKFTIKLKDEDEAEED